MRTNCRTCSRCSRERGLTLIEVVAAITILGMVLVGVVVAKSRHTHQLSRAQQKQVAVRVADDLISKWWLDSHLVPIDAEGELATDPPLIWRTRIVDSYEIEQLAARVVRVELFLNIAGEPVVRDEPLVMVDLVMSPTDVVGAGGMRWASPVTFDQRADDVEPEPSVEGAAP